MQRTRGQQRRQQQQQQRRQQLLRLPFEYLYANVGEETIEFRDVTMGDEHYPVIVYTMDTHNLQTPDFIVNIDLGMHTHPQGARLGWVADNFLNWIVYPEPTDYEHTHVDGYTQVYTNATYKGQRYASIIVGDDTMLYKDDLEPQSLLATPLLEWDAQVEGFRVTFQDT